MIEIADLLMSAGRSGVELALFVLLPVMVVMLTLMRLLEAKGVLDILVAWLAPVMRPFGIPGLGVFAMLQILFVSFAAPVATLALMDRSGVSLRHIAATLAMVLTLAQANVVFPMAAMGLDVGSCLLISLGSGILAASLTYYLFARRLPCEPVVEPRVEHATAEGAQGVLGVINRAGREAFDISVGALPMLILALVMVNALRLTGVIELLGNGLAPLFVWLGLPSEVMLAVITKYIAGGTAMMGVTAEFLNQGVIDSRELNRLAGFLIHPLDIAGIAVLISAGRRVASVLKPALWGAFVAILIRALIHGLIF